jgi:hypothetical protein
MALPGVWPGRVPIGVKKPESCPIRKKWKNWRTRVIRGTSPEESEE